MFVNIAIDFLLTMGTDVTNVPPFIFVTMVTRVTVHIGESYWKAPKVSYPRTFRVLFCYWTGVTVC